MFQSSSWRRRSSAQPVSMDRVPLMSDYENTQQHARRTSINSSSSSKPPKERAFRIADLLIVFLVLLLSETARGIVLPTLSPYVNFLGGNAVILGYAVAAFSVGRFVSTIGLGYLSTTKSYKVVLVASTAICIVGNVIYGCGEFWGPYVVLASRFITGFGAGTLSVIRAYVAHVTTAKERTKYMSILGAVQFFGFAIMPGIGSVLTYIPSFNLWGFSFDKYTAPGYLLAIANLLLLILLALEFRNPPPIIKCVDTSTTSPPSTPSSGASTPSAPSPHYTPSASPYPSPSGTTPIPTQPFPVTFPIVPLATPPYSPQFHHYAHPQPPHSPQYHPHSPHFPYPQPTHPHSPTFTHPAQPHSPIFTRAPHSPHSPRDVEKQPLSDAPAAPSRAQRFLIFGVFLALNLLVRLVLGIIETVATPVYVKLNGDKPGKDVEAGFVFGGLGLIGMAVLFFISWLSKHVEDFVILVVGLATLVLGSGLMVGSLDLPRFIIGSGLIWCIGYPLAQTIIVSMFSKMLGNKPQGTWMGWIGAMGSLGRIIGPIVSGFLLHNFGQSETFIFGTAVAAVSLAASMLLLGVRKH